MIRIEVQHFHGCPNSEEAIKRVRLAMKKSEIALIYREVLVETPEKAERYKFRGSPTILINGEDLEGMPEPESGHLACRYYKNGVPSVQSIIAAIEKKALNKGE